MDSSKKRINRRSVVLSQHIKLNKFEKTHFNKIWNRKVFEQVINNLRILIYKAMRLTSGAQLKTESGAGHFENDFLLYLGNDL